MSSDANTEHRLRATGLEAPVQVEMSWSGTILSEGKSPVLSVEDESEYDADELQFNSAGLQ